MEGKGSMIKTIRLYKDAIELATLYRIFISMSDDEQRRYLESWDIEGRRLITMIKEIFTLKEAARKGALSCIAK